MRKTTTTQKKTNLDGWLKRVCINLETFSCFFTRRDWGLWFRCFSFLSPFVWRELVTGRNSRPCDILLLLRSNGPLNTNCSSCGKVGLETEYLLSKSSALIIEPVGAQFLARHLLIQYYFTTYTHSNHSSQLLTSVLVSSFAMSPSRGGEFIARHLDIL